jgi:asparagine synthase (glutamine-hydrolysing)
MSSICGAFGRCVTENGGIPQLRRLLAPLESRGPDGAAEYADVASSLSLGFRFLKTEATEANPGVLANEDRTLLMVCDGHVFNSRDVSSFLRGRGRAISPIHSAELLLRLYEEEGIAGWRRADAQFALALWDARQRRLILGRDFLGVRSLYFASGPGGLVFASEIRTLLNEPGVPRSLDETAVSDFLTFTSVPGPRTLFRDIRKVGAGTAVVYSDGAAPRVERYWDLLDEPTEESDDERGYVERVRARHFESVQGRKIEGPVGSLLSGGNDSSANASLLARLGSVPLHTFTVGLAEHEGDQKYNDLFWARRVAEHIGSTHHEELLTTPEFLQTIPLTIEAMDDPVSEPSSVFLYHALRMAKEQNLRVVITGEANDELCCGHGGMIAIRGGYYRRWVPLMRKPAWIRRAAASVVPLAFPKYRDILTRAAAGEQYFWSYETAWMDSNKASVLAVRSEPAARIVDACRRRFEKSPFANRDYLFYVIYAMMQDFYFGNLMLGKLDRLSSALGVEPRCPYTAPAYAHAVFNVPASLKARGGMVKYFFKKAIEGVLPNEIIYRPKQGFRTPVVELFQSALGDWAEPILLETGLTREGLLKQSALTDILTRHRRGEGDYANRLWTAMVLNLWYERWIKGAAA